MTLKFPLAEHHITGGSTPIPQDLVKDPGSIAPDTSPKRMKKNPKNIGLITSVSYLKHIYPYVLKNHIDISIIIKSKISTIFINKNIKIKDKNIFLIFDGG